MNKRYIGALFLAPLLIFLFLGGLPLKILMEILSICGLYEYFKACKVKHYKPFELIAYVMCVIFYSYLGKNINYKLFSLILILSVFILLIIPVLNVKRNFIDAALTILGFIYVPVFFSFIVLTNTKEYGKYFVWLIFISSWLCDTTAYYAGRFFGKKKLIPKVSPKKTVEGAIGGLLGSAVACSLYGVYLNKITQIPIYHFLLIGLICGVFCQIGDLVASSIKRYVDIKDYSKLIPGHGGILDRFDSILYAAVVVYYYITFIIRI